MYKLLFYIVFFPLSIIPMKCLYGISNLLSWILKDVVKYRREVVYKNLRNSFPLKTEMEIKQLAGQFYRHLADLFIEGFKMLSISKKKIMIRYQCKNPELINAYYDEGQSVILVSGHYNNWEYMVLSLDMQFKHHGIGVGKPLSNKGFGDVLTDFRTRYGTEVIDAGNVKSKFEHYHQNQHLSAYMMLNDQSPGNSNKSYWTTFLNQDTPVIYGPEYYARKYRYPVFFYKVEKVKRGYYTFELELITADPVNEPEGSIIEKSVRLLEQQIEQNPSYWLWSHKRWKHNKK